jgi:hypothetical protein
MKYVIVQQMFTGHELVLLCAEEINHCDIVPPNMKPISAGFVCLSPFKIYGESESLLLKPRPIDALRIMLHVMYNVGVNTQALALHLQYALCKAEHRKHTGGKMPFELNILLREAAAMASMIQAIEIKRGGDRLYSPPPTKESL